MLGRLHRAYVHGFFGTGRRCGFLQEAGLFGTLSDPRAAISFHQMLRARPPTGRPPAGLAELSRSARTASPVGYAPRHSAAMRPRHRVRAGGLARLVAALRAGGSGAVFATRPGLATRWAIFASRAGARSFARRAAVARSCCASRSVGATWAAFVADGSIAAPGPTRRRSVIAPRGLRLFRAGGRSRVGDSPGRGRGAVPTCGGGAGRSLRRRRAAPGLVNLNSAVFLSSRPRRPVSGRELAQARAKVGTTAASIAPGLPRRSNRNRRATFGCTQHGLNPHMALPHRFLRSRLSHYMVDP
jgi:hypothetical protein